MSQLNGSVADHFVEITEMIGIGKGGQRAVNARLLILSFDNFVNSVKKSAIKRDGPVFFSSAPVKVAGDERIFNRCIG